MGRAKDLKDEEKQIIIKETAKGNSCAVIAGILDRHVKIVQRFFERSFQS